MSLDGVRENTLSFTNIPDRPGTSQVTLSNSLPHAGVLPSSPSAVGKLASTETLWRRRCSLPLKAATPRWKAPMASYNPKSATLKHLQRRKTSENNSIVWDATLGNCAEARGEGEDSVFASLFNRRIFFYVKEQVSWLILSVISTRLKDAQMADYFWLCLQGCFWKRLAFELVHWVKKIPFPSVGIIQSTERMNLTTTNNNNKPEEGEFANSFSAWARTALFLCPWTRVLQNLRP